MKKEKSGRTRNKTVFLLILLIPLLFALSAKPAHSQQSALTHITKIETGFLINTFIQDSDGFFWIGANNGLYKYDGYSFKQHVAGPASIAGSYVTALYEDSQGLIWIGTLSGLSVYNKNTNTFNTWHHAPDNRASISNDNIGDSKQQAIAEDSQKNIWVGTANGLNKFNRTSRTFTRYPNHFIDNDIWSIYLDEDHFLWIGTANGLHKFDPRRGIVLEKYKTDSSAPDSLHGKYISSILKDSDGTLWIGTMNAGINRMEKGQKKFTHYRHAPNDGNALSNDGILTIMEDTNKMIWFTTLEGGLNVFDKELNVFKQYRYDPNTPEGIDENYITAVYQDALGIIWFSSFGGVLHRSDVKARKIHSFVHNPQRPNSLSRGSFIVSGIEDQEGIIWIAVGSYGVNRYDRDTGIFTHYCHEPFDPESLPELHGQSVFEDTDGYLWITTRNWIVLFDKKSGKVLRKYPAENWPGSPVQDSTAPDIIWYGTWGSGILKFNRKTGERKYLTLNSKTPNEAISDNTISYLHQDDTGMIWLCTRGAGLDRFNPRTEKVIAKYKHATMDAETISSNTIYQLYQDSARRYWVMTDKGVDEFIPVTDRFRRHNRQNGLFPMKSACQILEDRQGYLWIAGYYSGEVVRFNPNSGVHKVYGTDDGILSGIGTGFAAMKTKDDHLWFFGREGINTFNPEQIYDNSYQPNVFITSLAQGGEEINVKRALERVEMIQLDWRHNYFEFKAAALNYLYPEHNRYRYKLEGIDHDWFDSGKIRQGRYTGITPGEYLLKIQGSNNDGIWSDKIAKLKVIVKPPWWKTRELRLSILLLLTGLVIGGFRWRIKTIANQKQRLEILVEEKTHELDERVKELNCLYSISQLFEKEFSTKKILESTTRLIPSSWQYPPITCARIKFKNHIFKSDNFKKTEWVQSKTIMVSGKKVGAIEIYYLEKKPDIHEGPFSKEERSLINAVAESLGHFIERQKAKTEREKLITKLQKALKKVKRLNGLLPICSNCKKIRDDKGYWNQIESYIHEHSEAEFSHGICPDCSDELSRWTKIILVLSCFAINHFFCFNLYSKDIRWHVRVENLFLQLSHWH